MPSQCSDTDLDVSLLKQRREERWDIKREGKILIKLHLDMPRVIFVYFREAFILKKYNICQT